MTLFYAILPPVATLVLLLLRRTGRETAIMTLLVVMVLCLLVPQFSLTWIGDARALGIGMSNAIPAAAILFPALLFYQLHLTSGSMTRISRYIEHTFPDPELRTLFIVCGVGMCIESLCGFSFGCVAILPLLLDMYTDKIKVALLSLLSQVIVPFNALALSIVTSAALAKVSGNSLGECVALLLVPTAIGYALLTLVLVGGKEAVRRHWMAAVASGSLLSAIAWTTCAILSVDIAGVLASLAVIAFLLIWSWATSPASKRSAGKKDAEGPSLFHALAPYAFLIGGLLLTRIVAPISHWFQTFLLFSWQPIHLHFALLYSPGLWLLLASLLLLPLFEHAQHIFQSVGIGLRQALGVNVTMLLFMMSAAIMQDAGMIRALSQAVQALGKEFVWISPLIGGIGAWIMSSSLGGDVLFVPLQQGTSQSTGLPLLWIIASQDLASALASTACPGSLILVAAALELEKAHEGVLLRALGPVVLWSLALITVLLIGIIFASPLAYTLFVFIFFLPLIGASLLLTVRKQVPFQSWWGRKRWGKEVANTCTEQGGEGFDRIV